MSRKNRAWRYRRKIALGERYNWKCQYCWSDLDYFSLTKDHIVPASAGGANALSNLVACCQSCNLEKKDTSLLVYVSSTLGICW